MDFFLQVFVFSMLSELIYIVTLSFWCSFFSISHSGTGNFPILDNWKNTQAVMEFWSILKLLYVQML